ncbi:hypothetical protein MP638_000673 [Amoeboaphelidium occidentale]|nr:hypothetical protein MP638_000673 [Amoeboaphelidium occidentale]
MNSLAYKRLYSSASNYVKKASPDIPDLSHPKWARREKLNMMNFMNKGKSGHKRKTGTGDGIPKDMRKLVEEEKLPELKTSQERVTNPEESITRIYDQLTSSQSRGAAVPRPLTKKEVVSKKIFKAMQELPLIADDVGMKKQLQLDIAKQAKDSMARIEAGSKLQSLTAKPVLRQETADLLAKEESSVGSPLVKAIAKRLLNEDDAFEAVTRKDWRTVLTLNSKLGKTQEAQKAFDLMRDNGMKAGTTEYRLLMDSYANANDLNNVLRVFKDMKQNSLAIDTPEFCILVKALVKQNRLFDAFRVYEEMKSLNVPITQPVYTLLLKGCSSLGYYDRAFTLFEHMKSGVCKPDELIYNHMIYICSKLNLVEKAVVLFDEMLSQRNENGQAMVPLRYTFHSLLSAFAKRPDYYAETFEIINQMTEMGYNLQLREYNLLLMASATQGDIPRAKALWQEMKNTVPSNEFSYMFLLATYSRGPLIIQKLRQEIADRKKIEKFQQDVIKAKMGLENEERMNERQRPVDLNEWLLDEKYDPDLSFEFRKSVQLEDLENVQEYLLADKTEKELLLEWKNDALEIFKDYLNKSAPNEALPEQKETHLASISETNEDSKVNMDVEVLNAYIDCLGSFRMKKDLMDFYNNFIQTYGVQKNQKTFHRTLVELSRGKFDLLDADDTHSEETKSWLLDSITKVYKDYERFRTVNGYPKRWDEVTKSAFGNKYLEKGINHKNRRTERLIMTRYIHALTRFNRVKEAAEVLNLMLERGHARFTSVSLAARDDYMPLKSNDHIYKKFGNEIKSMPTSRELGSDSLLSASATSSETGVTASLSSLTSEVLSSQQTAFTKRKNKTKTDGNYGIFERYKADDFSKEEFIGVVAKARQMGMMNLATEVENMLNKAQYGMQQVEKITKHKQERLMKNIKDAKKK